MIASQPGKYDTRPRSVHPSRSAGAFTLVELLVVISIIAVLMALLFPAMNGVRDQAKKTQAMNGLTQIVSAVTAYYTEYGKYPIASVGSTAVDIMYGDPNGSHGNQDVMNIPMSINTSGGSNDSYVNNPRQIVFLSPPSVKDSANPRGGVATADTKSTTWGAIKKGSYVDPWGDPYILSIDGDYSSLVQVYVLNYSDISYAQDSASSGGNVVRTGVIGASYGKDGLIGTKGDKKFKGSDNVISWQ